MKYWIALLSLSLFYHSSVFADGINKDKSEEQVTAIFLGLIVIVAIILMLIRRQKRRFND